MKPDPTSSINLYFEAPIPVTCVVKLKQGVVSFCEKLGYGVEERVSMGKRLT
jgi:hypothetical protein